MDSIKVSTSSVLLQAPTSAALYELSLWFTVPNGFLSAMGVGSRDLGNSKTGHILASETIINNATVRLCSSHMGKMNK